MDLAAADIFLLLPLKVARSNVMHTDLVKWLSSAFYWAIWHTFKFLYNMWYMAQNGYLHMAISEAGLSG